MKGKGANRICSLSMPESEAGELDAFLASHGGGSRSEFIRTAVKSLMRRREELSLRSGDAEGVIVLLYRHSADMAISEARHAVMGELIRSYTHADMEAAGKCCEVLFFSGPASRVKALVDGFRSIRGVEEAEVFLA